MRAGRNRSKGIALAFVLIVILVMTVIGFALGARGIQNLASSFHEKEAEQAYYASMAGISRAIYAIEQNDPVLPPSGQTGTPVFSPSQLLDDNAKFSVTITNNVSGSSNINAPDGTSIPPGMEYLVSTGTMGTSKRVTNLLAQVTSGWGYPFAAFGKNSVTFSGRGNTDSYNSVTGQTHLQNGNVGTNGISNGAVTLTGNSSIYGTISVGPGGTPGSPTISTTGNASYKAAKALPAPVQLPPPSDPLKGPGTTPVPPIPRGGVLLPGKYGTLALSGNDALTLSCGTYSIDKISISGNATVTIPSSCSAAFPVKIYVYNQLNISGNGIVNSGNVSTKLLIYGMPSLTNVAISGNGAFAGVVYAPTADFSVSGNGGVYGSIVGNTITYSGNANFYYDEALATDQNAGNGATVTPMSYSSH